MYSSATLAKTASWHDGSPTNIAILGVDAWLDKWELGPGMRLDRKIEEAIRTARFFAIIIASEGDDASRWVMDELSLALDEEDRRGLTAHVIPLVMDRSLIPVRLRNRLYIDLSVDYHAGLVMLVGRIREIAPQHIDAELRHWTPGSTREALEMLSGLGVQIWHLVDDNECELICRLGGEPLGNDRVAFDAWSIRAEANRTGVPIPRHLRETLELIEGT